MENRVYGYARVSSKEQNVNKTNNSDLETMIHKRRSNKHLFSTLINCSGPIKKQFRKPRSCLPNKTKLPFRRIYSTESPQQRGNRNGSEVMRSQPNDRAVMLGTYILENKTTVRAAAKQFGISKSTVHKDVSERLPHIRPELAEAVHAVLLRNKQERHIRGGMATKRKYALLAEHRGKQ